MFLKICGVTRVDDAAWAIQQGATALGLNFVPASPRYLPYAQAEKMLRTLPRVFQSVGVFVRPTVTELRHTLEMVGIQQVQLYEPNLDQLRPIWPLLHGKILLAAGIRDMGDLQALQSEVQQWRQAGVAPSAVLVDAKAEGVHGGTGQNAPWDLIRTWQWDLPVILAGGLTPANVAGAINAVQPWGVDVASGVEIAPGVKDRYKVELFLRESRAAYAQLRTAASLGGQQRQ